MSRVRQQPRLACGLKFSPSRIVAARLLGSCITIIRTRWRPAAARHAQQALGGITGMGMAGSVDLVKTPALGLPLSRIKNAPPPSTFFENDRLGGCTVENPDIPLGKPAYFPQN